MPTGTRGPLCETCVSRNCTAAYRWSPTAGLPCAVVWRLMPSSPRGAMHYCPRRLADRWCACPVGPPHHRKTWRTDPGRQDHTVLPYACHTGRVREGASLTVLPPCDASRADVTRVHRSSPHVSWRSRYAPLTGVRWPEDAAKSKFC